MQGSKHLSIGALILPCLFSRQCVSFWVDAYSSAVGAMAWGVVVPVIDPGLNISALAPYFCHACSAGTVSWVDAYGSAVGAMAWGVAVPVVDPGLNISFTRDCRTMTFKAWGSQNSGPNHPVKAVETIAFVPWGSHESGLKHPISAVCGNHCFVPWGSLQSFSAVGTIALYPGAAVNQDSNSPSVLLEPLLCTLGQPWIRTQTVLQCCWNHCFVPWGSRESGLKQSFSAVGTICFCKIAPGDHCFRKCMWCFGLSLLLHLSFLPLLFLLFDSSSF